MANGTKCPECGVPVGGDSGVSIYKHVVGCMHVPDVGAEKLLADHRDKDDERSRRITAAMRAAVREG